MRNNTRRLALSLSLVFVLMGATLPQMGCGGSAIREAAKASHRIQVVTDAAIDTTATLFHDHMIDTAKKNQIVLALQKVNRGNRVLIDRAKAATADTPEVRADLLNQLKVVEDAVKELKDLGVLGIHSKSGELAFSSAIAALDSSIAIIQSVLIGRK